MVLRRRLAEDAASEAALTAEEMTELARSRERSVRAGIAARVDLPLPTMLRLGTDRSPQVRAALAANPGVGRSRALMDALAEDTDVSVRLALVGNPATPVDALQRLALRSPGPVCAAAVERMDVDHAYDAAQPVVALRLAVGDDARPTRQAPVRGFKPAR
ncbi:hypothetical protein [Demequina capsici]|uniref:Leucine rich repeat variant n=1 Tax=Demequina capsici TaxID=3075620 RepID=A0AA96JDV6_9MICO|nr:hypothetical protein [Demequina sp. OYTSA14]WNM25079.1 hypothetical protein RN606_02725 [Demequina sp. OYTSA14]